jgi:hypothetical protein
MSLKKAIIANLPPSWDQVLREEKKLTAFVNYLYDQTPYTMKGSRNWKRGLENIKLGFRVHPIDRVINPDKTKEGPQYWRQIAFKIYKLEESWK